MASAQRGLQAKLSRRLGRGRLDAIRERLTTEQAGACACCGRSGKGVALNTHWALEETNDEGIPMLRGAICRSCKIAVNRVVHPSRFVLQAQHLAMVEVYLRRPWQDANDVLVRAGLERVTARSDALPGAGVDAVRRAVTDDVVGFLDEIGALPSTALRQPAE